MYKFWKDKKKTKAVTGAVKLEDELVKTYEEILARVSVERVRDSH
jgi:hypothetical protein